MPKAHKFTNGQNLTVRTSHDVDSDNDSIFKAAITQGVSKALGIEYHTVPGDLNLQKKLKRLLTLLKNTHVSQLRKLKRVGLKFYL